MKPVGTTAFAVVVLQLASPGSARAAETQARFELRSIAGTPFPSDWFTVADSTNVTGRRVALPKPDCGVHVSECLDIDTVNQRDGFNIQPRLSVPFSGPIDPSTATSENVFLVELAEAPRGWPPASFSTTGVRGMRVIGINQRLWDPETNTLHAESDAQLRQYTTYALVVTSGVRDASGRPVAASPQFRALLMRTGPPAEAAYGRRVLAAALAASAMRSGRGEHVVAASVFTTMSVTPILEKMRARVRAGPPPTVDLALGPNGERTFFAIEELLQLTYLRQNSVAGPLASIPLPTGSAGSLAFGRFRAPYFLAPERYIPTTGTAPNAAPPPVRDEVGIGLMLRLPAGPKPAGGWPLVVFGHGYGSNMFLSCVVQGEFTDRGMAVVAFNVVGHGGGPAGQMLVRKADGSTIQFAFGGRGEDRDGDGVIDVAEGMSAEGVWRLVGTQDGNRQAVAELVQLIRVIEAGLDVDGDGEPDLDPSRIHLVGHSNGSAYGTMLAAVEPALRGLAMAAPGATTSGSRLSPVFRPTYRERLGARQPSLLNVSGGTDFDENIPLRDRPVVVNHVPGAMKLQEFFEREEWAKQTGLTAAHAPYLSSTPLGCPATCSQLPGARGRGPGCDACSRRTPTLVQFVKGDEYVANPATSAMIRAGDLADVATYLRWDLLAAPLGTPHNFILNMPVARQQVAEFFASDGRSIVDPDGPLPVWETPVQPPLPEETNY